MSRFQPSASAPASGFGFAAVMAGPHRAAFRRWYALKSLLPAAGTRRDRG
jgi:hypothetical protein